MNGVEMYSGGDSGRIWQYFEMGIERERCFSQTEPRFLAYELD